MDDKQIIDTLSQAMWDAYVVLGFDPDGDTSPGAWIAGAKSHQGFAQQWLEEIRDHRKDDDEALDESIANDAVTSRVEALLRHWETTPALRRGTAAVELRKALRGVAL